MRMTELSHLASISEYLKLRLSPFGEYPTLRALEKLLAKKSDYCQLFGYLSRKEKLDYLTHFRHVANHEIALASDYHQRVKPAGWQTTNPSSHDPDNYRYIVHAIGYKNNFLASLRNEPLSTFPQVGKYEKPNTGDLPGFLNRNFISCSLIDEMHRATYVSEYGVYHGFIFEAPEANIVAIDPFDMGKSWGVNDPEIARALHTPNFELRERVTSAQVFLDDYVGSMYNEVVVSGATPAGRIKISGVFLKTEPVIGIPLYELYTRGAIAGGTDQFFYDRLHRRYTEAKSLASALGVPLVHIRQDVSPYHYQSLLSEFSPEYLVDAKSRF